MECTTKHRRAVVVASAERALPLVRLFEHPCLGDWGVTVADSPEHARFLTQLFACDVLIVDDSALGAPGDCCVRWLSERGRRPVIFLCGAQGAAIQRALAEGARLWLLRDLIVNEPALLAEGLAHALRARAEQRKLRQAQRQARLHRAQAGRLTDLLWASLPVEGKPEWLSQRFMLERLYQEVLRSNRHNTPLTLVLGEWRVDPAHGIDEPEEKPAPGLEAERSIREWTIRRVLENKRRSDVAGQYGCHGFMLLLPHTPDEGAKEFCRRLRHDLEGTPPGLPSFWRLHSALGTAGYSSEYRTPKSLLRLAEERLESDCLGEQGV